MNDIEEAARNQGTLAHIALTDDEREQMRLMGDGTLDVPLSVIRKMADWLHRFDARRPRQFVDRTPRR